MGRSGYAKRDSKTRSRLFDTKLTASTCGLIVGDGQVHPKCMASLVVRVEKPVMVSREGCYLRFLKGPGYESAPQTGLGLFLPKIGLDAYLAPQTSLGLFLPKIGLGAEKMVNPLTRVGQTLLVL